MKKRCKQSEILTKKDVQNFYNRTNLVMLILLIYTVLLLITSSKILDRVGQVEEDFSYYGNSFLTGKITESSISGNVTVTVGGAEEEEENVTVGAGGPGVGIGLEGSISFQLDPGKISVDAKENEMVTRPLKIINNGDITLDLNIKTNIGSYLDISPTNVIISPGEFSIVNINFNTKKSGLNMGYILVEGSGVKGYSLVIFNVNLLNEIGDVKLSIPPEYDTVSPGDEVLLNINLADFNLGLVDLVYIIKDSNNNEVFKITDLMTIKGEYEFDKILTVPDNLRDGIYVFTVEIRQNGLSVIDYKTVNIGDVKIPFTERPAVLGKEYVLSVTMFRLIVLLIVAMIILSFVMYLHEIRFVNKSKISKKNHGKK